MYSDLTPSNYLASSEEEEYMSMTTIREWLALFPDLYSRIDINWISFDGLCSMSFCFSFSFFNCARTCLILGLSSTHKFRTNKAEH